jgi:glycosyltransferase involved in cell wall biosynthesis
MEAALAGAEIVITQYGGTKDHFADYAEYIQPKSEGSLLAGIQKALRKQPDKMLKNRILTHFTWQKVAELTVEQYKKLIA